MTMTAPRQARRDTRAIRQPDHPTPSMPESVFKAVHDDVYRWKHEVTVYVGTLLAGIPVTQKTTEGWIKKNLGIENPALIAEMVYETMKERSLGIDEAALEVAKTAKLSGFKRDENGLYIEGRQWKAAIKEAAMIRWATKDKTWGPTRKGTKSYFAEHVFVAEDRIYLGLDEPTGVREGFVHTFNTHAISNAEYVDGAVLNFHVETDSDPKAPNSISDRHWAELFATSEMQGIGAGRSMGFGRYAVTDWKLVSTGRK